MVANVGLTERHVKVREEWEARQLEEAEAVRASAVYRFKREFFLTPRRDLLSTDIQKTLAGIVNHLYPPVTKENASDYINRAW